MEVLTGKLVVDAWPFGILVGATVILFGLAGIMMSVASEQRRKKMETREAMRWGKGFFFAGSVFFILMFSASFFVRCDDGEDACRVKCKKPKCEQKTEQSTAAKQRCYTIDQCYEAARGLPHVD